MIGQQCAQCVPAFAGHHDDEAEQQPPYGAVNNHLECAGGSQCVEVEGEEAPDAVGEPGGEDAAAIATREARLREKQAAAYGRPSTMLTPTGRTSMLGAALLPASTPKATNFGGVR